MWTFVYLRNIAFNIFLRSISFLQNNIIIPKTLNLLMASFAELFLKLKQKKPFVFFEQKHTCIYIGSETVIW